mmetsp:Transcript_32396/g.58584  ORF Transcript_32396/g.58584 Transcript_32396/m.58584 type:complete len:384 (+) Transcript_32396:99-1250(+)|eukprot:CAMPEP_0202494670 /NCGR_PEP_ID=MMETSP1361-20130828/13144_1 /ASSEMBLY_ACC=CAM_ASM_000849 /TAXON_ID=210615 /ORGANISM="Staurosira complex sp., Strain CCMP2646" /LENGTH=383 /DNA_ID=CAMNT_0049125311 /DNA_START=21 /DNA_END=1172 /DNA_ORIENTATION=-
MTTFQRHVLFIFLLLLSPCESFVVNKTLFRRRPALLHETRESTYSLVNDQPKTLLSQRISTPISSLPPPPEASANPSDDGFRSFRQNVPLSVQHWLRDSGMLRFIVNSLVYIGLPGLVQQYPDTLSTFLRLTNECTTIKYGNHPMQKMDVFEPKTVSKQSKGLVVICHGGAWGSGKKWMYRLTATRKLEHGYTIAVLGYRTYPDASVDGQVSDIQRSLDKLKQRYPSQHTTILGHSSGSHIALLGVLQRKLKVDALICVAGVYDVVKHFMFEKGRGVDMISPLLPANGHVEKEWVLRSPIRLVDETTRDILPPTLLVHGAKDSVVPYTSAVDFYNALQQCQSDENCLLSILPSTEHAETVIQLMVGGETQDIVMEWLESQVLE